MAKAESKNVVLEEISEKLGEICSSMASIEERLDDITMSCSMLVFFRLVELRPAACRIFCNFGCPVIPHLNQLPWINTF
jgi:hypothetical protein